MQSVRILGALIAGALVISSVAQDHHPQPPTSSSVTAIATAETSNIAETPATASQGSPTPQDPLEVESSGDTLVVPPPHSSPDVSQAIVNYLELTPVQIAAIQAQIDKERGRVRPLVKRLAKNRRALVAAMLKGRFDVRQVRDLAAEQSRVQEQLIDANLRLQVKAYKILTVEQQRKLHGMTKETAGLTHPSLTEW